MSDEISIKEMEEFLMDKNRHNILCTCSKCEKEFEEFANSKIMELDLKDILNE